ncbi:MAG TPA: hypothetical protein VFR17_02725 [Mycobacterium sp.]|nr:hypothetical protein [Mycobacterium sp.]
MAKNRKKPTTTIAVGSRVHTTDSPPRCGVVVDDFGELAGQEVSIDPTRTARSRRWAVTFDDGTLAFLDDDSIAPAD